MRGGTLRSTKGLTLIEIIFVLAIFAVLVAIIVPIATSLLSDSNAVKAQADEDALSAALTKFFVDNGLWPASDGTSSSNQSVTILLLGDGGPTTTTSAGLTSPNPSDASPSSSWSPLPTIAAGSNAKNNALNHLLVNNPNGDGTEGGSNDYKTTGSKRWRGPYVSGPSADPFGNNYVINIGGVTGNGAGKGWILSAGKDGTLQTAKTASTLSGDDIGFIYCTGCQ